MAEHAPPTTRLDPVYLEGLFVGARLAIIACDPAGTILNWNLAAAALFPEIEQGEYTGRAVTELFPSHDRELVRSHLEACVETLEPQEFDWQRDPTAPHSVVYGVWWTPVVRSDGVLHGVSLWFRDITQRIRLKRAVESRQRLNVLGSLAGAVAHHYNNLLCSIGTSIEYAGNMTTTNAMRRALQRTGDAVTRAAEITRQLLAFARADHREQTYSDLTEAVLYYFDENEARLREQRIELRLDWERVPVCAVPREQFSVVLDNLVRNAVEAMPDGGTLTARVIRHDEKHIAVSLTDTGAGIPGGAIEHLFEPFFTTKGVLGAGTGRNAGMGLAVVHGFVSEMGGFVSAGNVSGNGARFEVILPVRKEG